jgi:hypothetical protein
MEYNNYTEFCKGVAEAEFKGEVSEHYLLEDFNFGFERKYTAHRGFSETFYNIFDKEPFSSWVDVTEDYVHQLRCDVEKELINLQEEEGDDSDYWDYKMKSAREDNI